MSINNNKTYAVIHNGTVENFILADSKSLAEEISEKECIEVTNEIANSRAMEVGMLWNGEHFVGRKPADSWIWDSGIGNWIPPIPYPEDHNTIVNDELVFYIWLESEQRWLSNKEVAS